MCCQWKKRLKNTFGKDLLVKLDLFHAMQRITHKLSKRHQLYNNCVSDLRLVFRDNNDQGTKRTKPTPEPNELLENMEQFIQKWKSLATDNQRVLTPEALVEIDKLKRVVLVEWQ